MSHVLCIDTAFDKNLLSFGCVGFSRAEFQMDMLSGGHR